MKISSLATGIAVSLTVLASTLTGVAAQAAGPVTAGLAVTSSTVTVTSGGSKFSALLVQPTGSAPHAYPVVAFGHGFLQGTSRYASTLSSIAARGYVVIAPNTQGGLLPYHSAFADDLWKSITWAQTTLPNADPSVDAVVGHSMGGGAAILAASRHPQIDTVATMAAAETNPSAVAASRSISAPALFLVGSSDGVVSPATTRKMYDAKPSPATWVSITGGFHCGFLDSSSFFGIGCDSGSISRSTQLGLANPMLGSWLDARLKGGPGFVASAGTTVEQK